MYLYGLAVQAAGFVAVQTIARPRPCQLVVRLGHFRLPHDLIPALVDGEQPRGRLGALEGHRAHDAVTERFFEGVRFERVDAVLDVVAEFGVVLLVLDRGATGAVGFPRDDATRADWR